MSEKAVITLENVGVRYTLRKERPRTVQEYLIGLFKNRKADSVVSTKEADDFWALRNITISVMRGEGLGIIGHNGAGKSTLLRVISGVIPPTEGKAEVTGKISPIVDIGAGFAPDLTGLENIYMSASVLGFSKQEIEERIPDIIEFSGLGDFINAPIRSYSTGMLARLGFSVAVEVDPDIMIIDEVLAVGDQQFKKKCLDKINDFKEKGITILFVSHSIPNVVDLCDRIAWLKHGRLYRYGSSEEIAREYLQETGPPFPSQSMI